jgi:hypothetical protein
MIGSAEFPLPAMDRAVIASRGHGFQPVGAP